MVRSGGEIFAPTRSASSVNGSFWSVVVQIGETISGPTPPSFSIGRPQTSRFGNRSLDAPGTRDLKVSSVTSVSRIVGSIVRASWATPAGTVAEPISRLTKRPADRSGSCSESSASEIHDSHVLLARFDMIEATNNAEPFSRWLSDKIGRASWRERVCQYV